MSPILSGCIIAIGGIALSMWMLGDTFDAGYKLGVKHGKQIAEETALFAKWASIASDRASSFTPESSDVPRSEDY
jgi:hypothetical protein